MLSTKTRNILIALVASASFAGTSLAPAVSMAADGGGCDAQQAGDVVVHENKSTINGRTVVTETWTEICGKDGKWHKVASLEVPPSKTKIVKTAPVAPAAPVKEVSPTQTKTSPVVSKIAS